MENEKINWMRPAIYSVLVGIMFASFSQSCSVTKASITRYILPVKLNDLKITPDHTFKYTGMIHYTVAGIDTNKTLKSFISAKNNQDTTNYSRMILDNQQLSLLNEKKILDLLLKKESENKKLKQVVVGLKEKVVITKDEKEDAIGLKAIWDMGNKLLTLCAAILGLLILQNIGLFVYYRKQFNANERHTCNPH